MKLFRSRYFLLAIVLALVLPHVVRGLVGVLHPEPSAVVSITESRGAPAPADRE